MGIQYKLLGENSIYNNSYLLTLLKKRGINFPEEYINLDDNAIQDYSYLDNISQAAWLLERHIKKGSTIGILVDEDVDGFTSAATMYLYLKNLGAKVYYIIHKVSKVHGLGDFDFKVEKDIDFFSIDLLIIPDAGTNDAEQCKLLKEQHNIDTIILDHHEKEVDNPYSIIVNNQMSYEYKNKELSGVGVVYRFLQCYDDLNWEYRADDYLDLVALGLIGDMMDIKSYETKRLIDKGLAIMKDDLSESNPFLMALIKAQDYSMNGVINNHTIQWYIVPVINGMIRSGSLEEKELMFRAFIKDEKEKYNFKKRSGEIIEESIYDHVARLCKNAKARQDRRKEPCVKKACEVINKNYNEDKVIFVDGTEIVDNSLTGVVASKLAETYTRPVVLLNKDSRKENTYGGSIRNCKNSFIENLKDVLEETKEFDWLMGHQNACGFNINASNIEQARMKLNNLFKDCNVEKIYPVDFVIEKNEVDVRFIQELGDFNAYIGQGIDEAEVAIKTFEVETDDITLMGKEKNTISFYNDVGVKFIKFKCHEDDKILKDIDNNKRYVYELELVGKPTINVFQGIATPQFVIDDYNILSKEELKYPQTAIGESELDCEESVW